MLIIFLFFIFSLILANHRATTPRLDIFDEGAHLDYSLKLSNGHIPRWDDKLGQETLLIADCVGGYFTKPSPCVPKSRNPDLYGASGFSYEAQQPPIAYIPFAVMKHFANNNPTKELIDIRKAGIFWTILSAIVILFLANHFKLYPLQVAVFAGVTLLNPAYINATGTINNDASALFFGMLTIYLIFGISTDKKRIHYLFGALLGLTKLLFAALPAALFLVAFIDHKKRVQNNFRNANKKGTIKSVVFTDYYRPLRITIGASVSGLVWLLFQSSRSEITGIQVQKALLGFLHPSRPRLSTIISSINTNLEIGNSYSPNTWLKLASLLMIGAAFAVVLDSGESLEKSLGKAFLTMSGILAVGWNFLIFIQTHFDVGTAARYMIPSLPLIGLFVTGIPKLYRNTLLALIVVGSCVWLITPI
jgi:hypothetical protein